MNVSSNMSVLDSTNKISAIKPLFTQKISKDDVKEIKEQIQKNANSMAFNSTSVQNAVFGADDKFTQQYEEFQSFFKDIGYDGKAIASLSQEEATALVSEDGFFGVSKTSTRIADFVINGAGGDEDRLRAGREGMIQGFKEAELMWGGELPDISQETMAKSIELVDKAMYDLGFSILNKEA